MGEADAADDDGPLELVDILLVDDDPGDITYVTESLALHRVRNGMTVHTDGAAALRYLRGNPPHQVPARPDVVLLDPHLRIPDGRTVLQAIRDDPRLRSLTVVALTTSPVEERLLRDFGADADHYLAKPVDFERLADLVRRIDAFGLRIDRLR